jgi:uncharacterized protein
MTLRFEWDENKSIVNKIKHGVSFEEAKTIFFDLNSVTIADTAHSSSQEERYIDIGISAMGQLLVVVYIERAGNIRIISCRKAQLKERRIYEQS